MYVLLLMSSEKKSMFYSKFVALCISTYLQYYGGFPKMKIEDMTQLRSNAITEKGVSYFHYLNKEDFTQKYF